MSTEKVDAWMPLWIGAYLADTMTLTTQQHGAYLLMLFAYWRNRGPLVDDDEDLASIVKASPSEWRKLRIKLARFFEIGDGVWAHGRADKELLNAGMRKAAAVSKAKAAAGARWEKSRKECSEHAPSIAQALREDCPTPPPKSSPSSKTLSKPSASHPPGGGLPDGFPKFWAAWPKGDRKQDKAKCAEVWKAKDLVKVADEILADVRAKRGTTKWAEGYIEAPLVYLRNRRWEDGNTEHADEQLGDWRAGRSSVEAMGVRLGLGKWDEAAFGLGGESFKAYESRVVRAFEEREVVPA